MNCIDAVLFDFDGVLIDSLACMESAWSKTKQKVFSFSRIQRLCQAHWKTIPNNSLRVKGR